MTVYILVSNYCAVGGINFVKKKKALKCLWHIAVCCWVGANLWPPSFITVLPRYRHILLG
jgi:hypothetical protein